MKLNVQRLEFNLLRVFDGLMQEQNLSRPLESATFEGFLVVAGPM